MLRSRDCRAAFQRHQLAAFSNQKCLLESRGLQRGQHQFGQSTVVSEFGNSTRADSAWPGVVMPNIKRDLESALLATRPLGNGMARDAQASGKPRSQPPATPAPFHGQQHLLQGQDATLIVYGP